jgi:hypothetical protein
MNHPDPITPAIFGLIVFALAAWAFYVINFF